MRETKGLQSLRQNFKSFQKERTIQLQKNKIQIISFLNSYTRGSENVFNMFQEKNIKLKILCPVKLSFKYEKAIRTFCVYKPSENLPHKDLP